MTLMLKEVALKGITNTSLEWEKLVESLETDTKFLLQMSDEALQRSCQTKSHPGGEERYVINSVHNQFICIAVQMEKAIDRWCSKELSEVGQYEKQNEQN